MSLIVSKTVWIGGPYRVIGPHRAHPLSPIILIIPTNGGGGGKSVITKQYTEKVRNLSD